MVILYLATSPFFGGPERLVLGLAQSLPESCRSAFALFPDRGKSRAFRQRLIDHGLEGITLAHDTPHLPAMVRELTSRLREWDADVVCCHGYKADIVGMFAARRAGVPAIAMSHGWTAETWKVRIYEILDRACL
jgi:Glycosyltransferase Family 4